ncbi:MAG: hypothetical protein JWR63_992 [Conexibacter sp.]|nr:hypothetical protein [Conexibacter sp.]
MRVDAYVISGWRHNQGPHSPVTMDASVEGTGEDAWGTERVGIRVRGKLDCKDFGLTWPQPLAKGGVLVGEEVKIPIDVSRCGRHEQIDGRRFLQPRRVPAELSARASAQTVAAAIALLQMTLGPKQQRSRLAEGPGGASPQLTRLGRHLYRKSAVASAPRKAKGPRKAGLFLRSGRQDLNLRPPGPQPGLGGFAEVYPLCL